MKTVYFKAYLVYILVLITPSCSSDDSESPNNISETEILEISYDGEIVNIIDSNSIRSENVIVMTLTADDDRIFSFLFNVFGDLEQADVIKLGDFDFPDTSNFAYYSSHYLDFELNGLDEASQRSQITVNGQMFEDQYNENSQSHTLSAKINLPYTVVQPQVSGLDISANINNIDWHGFNLISGFGQNQSSSSFISENGRLITFYYPSENLFEGSFSFSEPNSAVRVEYSQYDPNAQEFIDYTSVGSLNIEEILDGLTFQIVSGSFSFTATDSNNETVEVVNGQFKSVF